MDDVHKQASGTDQEVADWRTTLNNHTHTLNAMSEQIDNRFNKVEAEMRDGFAKVNEKFELLHQGQEQITNLLTRHLGEPDEKTRAGDADE